MIKLKISTSTKLEFKYIMQLFSYLFIHIIRSLFALLYFLQIILQLNIYNFDIHRSKYIHKYEWLCVCLLNCQPQLAS